jgi:tetratricopeptide (TPR) repeat protein
MAGVSDVPSPATLLADARDAWRVDPDAAAARLADGLAAIEAAGETDPAARVRLRSRLGQLRLFLGDVPGALRVLFETVEIAPDGYAQLQLGNALAWRGRPDDAGSALAHAEAARAAAGRRRDGPLALAASCLLGDLRLAGGDADAAVHAYGEALGISEFARDEAASVTPLAGLAAAHHAGRAPAKAGPLARRALARAEAAGDAAGAARAWLVLAACEHDMSAFGRAAEAADAAPHRPLALRARRRRFEAGGGGDRTALLARARAMGLAGEAAALARAGEGEAEPPPA